ncbi:MAG: hypothetical protein KA807_03640 [Prolixibacteraceae bacterium]|nr:hypothetical protein [Prolixibacteraceae bacterium]
MKRNLFSTINKGTLLKLNLISIVVIAFCELFVLYTFFSKGMEEGIELWKYKIILIGLILVSLLFLASIISFVYYFYSSRKQ